jgi:nitrate reductase cytochrome c-type subunit
MNRTETDSRLVLSRNEVTDGNMKKKMLAKPAAALALVAVLAVAAAVTTAKPPKEQSEVNSQTATALEQPQAPPIDAKVPQNLSTAVFGMG